MPDTRQTLKNAVPNQSDGNIEDAIWRLKINDNQDGGGLAQSNILPDRPGEPDCIYYLRTGLCGYGNNCRFNHPAYAPPVTQYNGDLPERIGQPDCGYFLKTGTCKYGSTCKFHHPRDRRGAGPVNYNVLGLPMRQEEKPCPYYMRTGECKFGPACKFHHPQPASVGTMIPVAAAHPPPPPPPLPPAGTAVMPSSNLTYAGWSFPRVPYMAAPQPQSYIPLVVPPSQGVISAAGWNTYVGNMPVSSPGILGPNHAYKNPGELGLGGQMQMSPNSSLILPERPDQPECRYFMNTGTCKYGTDCKYHHPRERMTQLATNQVMLPSRPGEAICSYYSTSGICKYGTTCKFDHPPPMANYGVSLPAMFDSAILNYQRDFSAMQLLPEIPHSMPSKSFGVSDNKPFLNKCQNSETRLSEDSAKQSDSVAHSPPSSEVSEDLSG